MPRKSLSSAESLAIVKEKIAAAGGKITHKALISQLDADGNGKVALFLVNWATKTGPLQGHLDLAAAPDERLSYSVRDGVVQ